MKPIPKTELEENCWVTIEPTKVIIKHGISGYGMVGSLLLFIAGLCLFLGFILPDNINLDLLLIPLGLFVLAILNFFLFTQVELDLEKGMIFRKWLIKNISLYTGKPEALFNKNFRVEETIKAESSSFFLTNNSAKILKFNSQSTAYQLVKFMNENQMELNFNWVYKNENA